ncbi:MAG: hypothetical protein ACI97B_004040, partial [Verrucomicrobiales bacterium]
MDEDLGRVRGEKSNGSASLRTQPNTGEASQSVNFVKRVSAPF